MCVDRPGPSVGAPESGGDAERRGREVQGVLEEPGEDVERRGGEVTRSVGGREKRLARGGDSPARGGDGGRRAGQLRSGEGEGTGGIRAE